MNDTDAKSELKWYRVAALDELAEGSVKKVVAGTKTIALTHFEGKYGALDNTCPHMGGPLAEGSIEYGVLVCPWHGREYHPVTGRCESYEEQAATLPVDVRSDGIYVGVE